MRRFYSESRLPRTKSLQPGGPGNKMGSMQARRLFVALMLLLFSGLPAYACDPMFMPISELYEKADAVFVAKVIESSWKRLPDGTISSRYVSGVRVAIERSFRGVQDKEIQFPSAGDCTYVFLEGERYLIHAYRNNGKLETGQAWRPLPIAEATEALKYIDSLLNNRPAGMLRIPTASNLIVRLEGSGTRLEARVTPANNEIAVPPGDYTIWLERDGKIVSETKRVTVTAKKTVSERF